MKPSPAPLPVPAEALNVRAELDAASGTHAAAARRALVELLNESAEEGAAGSDETPPLPDRLRSRWQDAYGPAAPASPQGAGASAFTGWLRALLAPRQLAWAGGLATVVLVAVVAVMHESGSGTPGDGPPVTRGTGGADAAGREGAPIYIVSTDPAASAAAKRLGEVFPQRLITVTADATDVPPASATAAVVVDTAAGTVTLFSTGNAVRSWPVATDALAQPDALVLPIEDADEAAAAAAPAQ